MSALAFNLLRIAYLVLLWLFVLFAIGVLRRDLLTRARDTASGFVKGGKRGRKAQAQAQVGVPMGPGGGFGPVAAAGVGQVSPGLAAPSAAGAGPFPAPIPAPFPGPVPAQVAGPAGGYAVGGVQLPPGAPPPAGSEPRPRRRGGRTSAASLAPAPGRQVQSLAPAPTELIVTAGSLLGTRLPLSGSSVLIGRAPGATLQVSDDFASSRHARIFQQSGVWFLEDLGSTNGTFVSGQRVTGPVPLEVGTAVQIGQSMIELR